VQAADYEIEQMGRPAAASARHEAAWRRAPAPAALVRELRAARGGLMLLGETLRLSVWERVTGKSR
jgi:hypothetical protein